MTARLFETKEQRIEPLFGSTYLVRGARVIGGAQYVSQGFERTPRRYRDRVVFLGRLSVAVGAEMALESGMIDAAAAGHPHRRWWLRRGAWPAVLVAWERFPDGEGPFTFGGFRRHELPDGRTMLLADLGPLFGWIVRGAEAYVKVALWGVVAVNWWPRRPKGQRWRVHRHRVPVPPATDGGDDA